MALFTRLSDEEIADVARRFRLGALARAEPLWAGTVNSNFRLETAAGGVFFLRVNEGKTEDDVSYEAELVEHLSTHGVSTPRPVAADDGRPWARLGPHLMTLFPWVAGEHRDPPAAAECAALGQALARFHLAGRGFARHRESRYSFPRIVSRWRGIQAPDAEIAAALADLALETEWLTDRSAARAALATGVIHGDLFPDNVLYTGSQLTALLDFEQASDGTLAYDLAVCLCSWCTGPAGGALDPARATALVAGYAAVRPLAPAERDALWVEARAAAMRFVATRLTDVELNPGASENTRRTKDFRVFLATLRALRAAGRDGLAAATASR
jgi:homoserine kinase type II